MLREITVIYRDEKIYLIYYFFFISKRCSTLWTSNSFVAYLFTTFRTFY